MYSSIFEVSKSSTVYLVVSLVCLSLLIQASEDSVVLSGEKTPDSTLSNADIDDNPKKPLPTDNGEGGEDIIPKRDTSYEKLLFEGQKAYYDNLWYSCTYKLEKALKLYKSFKETTTDCRLQCLKGNRQTKLSNFTISVEAFSKLTYFLTTADCMRRCKKDLLGDQQASEYDWVFEQRKPYLYLQYCYYKLDRLQQAASATYTYFLANPDDVDTNSNMKYYKETAKIPLVDFLDMEMTPYREHFIRGTLAYADNKWSKVVSHMEEALTEFFQENQRCQANCYDTGELKGSDFITFAADQIIKVMICQMECEIKLSVVYTDRDPEFLQSIFHYLQYAHYQLKDLKKSAEAMASFLLLNPDHQVMNENKAVVKKLMKPSVDEDFTARESLQLYVKWKREMADDMDFINKNYKWEDLPEEKANLKEDDSEEEEEGVIAYDWMMRYEKLGMTLIARAEDLHGEQRFVTDGVLKQEHCDELLNLMADVPQQARGVQVFDWSHAKKTMESRLDEDYETSLRMLVRSVEVIRQYTQRHNNPGTGYMVKKTSIVCWNSDENGEELDCHPQEDGTCVKYENMSDDFSSDLYTTVTYLTAADEEGDFVFLGDNEKVDAKFGLKCGRTVGFNTGDKHSLKVPKTTGTKRCALHISHSTLSSDDDQVYQDTIALMHRLDALRMERNLKSSEDVMKSFEDKGVKVVKTGKELHGKERVVVDGLATNAECQSLNNMILSGAIFGDGYDHQFKKPSHISPHTKHEFYQGINLYRASKIMHEGKVSTVAVKTFLEVSESSRLFVERYFNLTKPLYFDYTHLVCRSAVDAKEDRKDLSHPVHADNCVLQSNGTCIKDFPAFTQRDYSAVLYMNDDFEGGEFFFAHSNTSEQVSVRPKCGRLVGFNAGDFHGVKAVRSGQRCAVALWFTLNPNYKELAHVQARKNLKEMENSRPVHQDL